MNKVLLTGRLTRDPEMRSLASGKVVTTFTVASNEFLGAGKEKAEYHPVVAWDRLAEIAGRYLGKGQQVAIEGRLQTRSWDDDKGARHWKTEIVASHVEMLSGRKKKDYEAEQAADSLVAQAEALGDAASPDGPDPRRRHGHGRPTTTRRPRKPPPDHRPSRCHGGASPSRAVVAACPPSDAASGPPSDELVERHREDRVDEHQQRPFEPVRLAVERDERADPDGRGDRGDLERREDQVHRLADHDPEEHEHRRDESATCRLDP